MDLRVTWANAAGFHRFNEAMHILGSERMVRIGVMALNRTGDQSRTKVRQALTEQTGLKRKTVVKAVRSKRAAPGMLEYRMEAQGGDIALKFFSARETRAGVSATPFGKRRVFAGDFIKGGRFPGRKELKLGGHVFLRADGSRLPIAKEKSGVIIPTEMVKGETAQAFRTTVDRVLPQRLAHEIKRATKGVVT